MDNKINRLVFAIAFACPLCACLDRDKLDTIMFEIAGDPELPRAYLIARRTR